MAGYTKSDYDSLYSIRVRIWDEAIKAYRRSPVRLHYHRAVMQDMVRAHWDKIVLLLGIISSDRVVVVGAGFGWGVERLIELTGCTAVGIDISNYVISTKDDTEEAEIDAAIIAAGYDPLTGHGLDVKNATYNGEPKAKKPLIKEDLLSTKSRNAVRKALGNQLPTWIITEDLIFTFTDAEITAWKTEIDKLGVPVCHLLRENHSDNPKTGEDWATFTGHTIITIGDYRQID